MDDGHFVCSTVFARDLRDDPLFVLSATQGLPTHSRSVSADHVDYSVHSAGEQIPPRIMEGLKRSG